jgi:hypothetical protein
VLEAHEYSDKLEGLLFEGLQLFDLNVWDRSVLLKPNLVEDLPGRVNPQSVLVAPRRDVSVRFRQACVTAVERS